jgi:hypothetical protein
MEHKYLPFRWSVQSNLRSTMNFWSNEGILAYVTYRMHFRSVEIGYGEQYIGFIKQGIGNPRIKSVMLPNCEHANKQQLTQTGGRLSAQFFISLLSCQYGRNFDLSARWHLSSWRRPINPNRLVYKWIWLKNLQFRS